MPIQQKASNRTMAWRHYKALSKKNWINWKRTPIGNILELGCPIILTLFMLSARMYIEQDYWQDFPLDKVRHAIYPGTQKDRDGNYLFNIEQMVNLGERVEEFVVNGGQAEKGVGYIPFADVTGPLLFFPQQCTPDPKRKIYGSPLIAYIKNENPVQKELVKQVKSHFDSFGIIIDIVLQNDIFLNTVTSELKKLKTQDAIEAEAVSAVADSQMNLWSGKNRKFSELKFPEIRFRMKGFDNRDELTEYLTHKDYGHDGQGRPGVCFAFELEKNANNKYELDLMFNDQIVLDYRSIPNQMDVAADENQMFPQLRAYAYYNYYGFAYMQNWAANTVLRHATGKETAEVVAMTVPFKLIPMLKDPFLALLFFILPNFIMLMFIPLIYRLTYRIVREKEMRTKELMAEMGMQTISYWMSWATYFMAVNFMMTITSWTVLWFGCFYHTGGMVLFLIIFLYGQSIFGFIMLMQSFFTEARTAAVTTTIVYFGSALTLQVGEQAPTWKKFLMALSPCACMQATVKVIAGFEGNGVGVTMDHLSQSYRNWNCALGFSMFVISFIIMNILGVYFDNVVPRKYGKSHACCYCLPCKTEKKSKFNRAKNRRKQLLKNYTTKGSSTTDYVAMSRDFETRYTNPNNYEGVPHNIAQQEEYDMLLKIEDMMKTYPNGTRAVNGINVKLYADQIFVMLGHNGAGKSSLISILTGLYEPTQGSAEVYGVDMIKDFDKVRSFLGICPQHDVYFDLLTPREHLDIFYDFKGGEQDAAKKKAEVDGLIKSVGLFDQQHDLTSKLSGGYQRKLSCCQALVGGSKLIIMDEPTSSLDLNARRQIWNCLKEYKKDRIVLLTTHYMDEADILGDRIGIMTKGKITCLGSSLFLKRQFGVGYNLAMVKASAAPNTMLESYFQQHLGPKAKKLTEVQTEIIMQVPLDYAPKFQQFFDKFDAMMPEFGIVQYGISITTLEDVFLNVGHLADNEETPTPGSTGKRSSKKRENGRINPDQWDRTSIIDEDQDKSAIRMDSIDHKNEGLGEQERDSVDFNEKDAYRSPTLKKNKRRQHNSSSKTKGIAPAEEDLDMTEMAMSKQKYHTKDSSTRKLNDDEFYYYQEKNRNKDSHLEYSLAFNGTENSFQSSFMAVLYKRIQLWQSSRKMIFEFALPCCIMIFGVALTSIDMNQPSVSRLIDPSRISTIPNGQPILFDNDVVLKGGNVKVQDLIDNFPRPDLFEFHTKNTSTDFMTNSFNTFWEFTYWFGRSHRSTWPFVYGSYQIYEADTESQKYKFYSFVNLTNSDSAALYPQYMYESIMKTATNDSDFEFKVRNSPMPVTNEVFSRKVMGNAAAVIFLTAVAYGMLMTSIVGGIVWERMSGIKHMQMISGMDRAAYWIANFIIDLIQVEVIVLISVLTFYLANLKYSTSWIIYMLFPVAAIPLTYVTSYFFGSESAAQTGTIFMNFGTILFGSTLVYYLRFIKQWEVIGDYLNMIFKVLPPYTLGASIYFDASIKDLVEFRDATLGEGKQLTANPWVLENLYGDMISYMIHFVFWVSVLIAIEMGAEKTVKDFFFKLNQRRFPSYNKSLEFDSDVVRESQRVNDPDDPQFKNDEDMQIKVKNLRKVYMKGNGPCNPGEPLCAVERLSFGLEKGECFALLGVNGAGKSTTFKILTAGEDPTEGQIAIQGLDMQEDFQEVRRLLGYCPQQDPIFEALTVEQNIEYFARIKGIPTNYRGILIENAISKLGLQDHRKKPTGTLSGGNKRKVSVAISIVGNPPIILLDEPSAGMDPEARRFMWSVIAGITSKKTSAVILTSHLMEEAEALSTKMGIMIKGGIFKCFGSSQHIKDKFGKEKYEVEIKIEVPTHDQLKTLAETEFVDLIDEEFQINIVQALHSLQKKHSKIILDKIVEELITTYKNASINIHMLRQAIGEDQNNSQRSITIKCSAIVFAEKLFTQRNMFGTIEAICRKWQPDKQCIENWARKGEIAEEDPRKIELLEQYGNYSRLRLSLQEKTLGQMFGMVEGMKEMYRLDQYSISQIKLEQIFQSLANIDFDGQVKSFALRQTRSGREELYVE